MVEGKKNLPGEAENATYPIDVEVMLTSLGLYEELGKIQSTIEIMRCIYGIFNTAYGLGKDGEPLDPDMVTRFQGLATICERDEHTSEIVFALILRLYKAYAQGCKDRGK